MSAWIVYLWISLLPSTVLAYNHGFIRDRCPSQCECQENEVGKVTINCAFSNISPPSVYPQNVHTLNLSQTMSHSLTNETFNKKELLNLENLDMSRNPIFHMMTGAFQYPINLREINLSSCNLTDLPPELFKNNKHLQKLDARNNNINCDKLRYGLPHVKVLCDENPVRNQITIDISTTIQKNIPTTQDPTLTSYITKISRNRGPEELSKITAQHTSDTDIKYLPKYNNLHGSTNTKTDTMESDTTISGTENESVSKQKDLNNEFAQLHEHVIITLLVIFIVLLLIIIIIVVISKASIKHRDAFTRNEKMPLNDSIQLGEVISELKELLKHNEPK